MPTNQQEAKKLEARILSILQKYITGTGIVIAGISGGPDSVFLLHLLKQIPCRKIIIAHVNHQLRKEANTEENFVKKIAAKNPKTLFKSLKIDIKFLSKKQKQGFEETGRQIRYDFFKKLAKEYRAKFIITAHHADDNLETIILNFARGAGLQGLSGMKEIENFSSNNQSIAQKKHFLFLLRPLLSISKKQILDYLKFRKIPYKIDKSNLDTKYKRNFIRHKIIPLFSQLNPNISQTISTNSQNLKELDKFTKDLAQNWIKNNFTKSNQATSFDAKKFRQEPPIFQKIILFELYKDLIGNTTNLKSKNFEEVLQLINSGIGNKEKKLGKLKVFLKSNLIKISTQQ